VIRKGPAISAAYDSDGIPSKAALGFARSCNKEIQELETQETDKGSWLIYRNVEQGQPTSALLPEIIQTALSKLPIQKRMRWADYDTEFVRPVHWSIVMMGKDIIPCQN